MSHATPPSAGSGPADADALRADPGGAGSPTGGTDVRTPSTPRAAAGDSSYHQDPRPLARPGGWQATSP
eukprot:7560173-Pyramimonas_sp.AAC.1